MRKVKRVAFVTALVVMCGCSGSGDGLTVRVLTEVELDGATVEPEQITFQGRPGQVGELATGDIIVSAVGYGFLREIVSVSDASGQRIIGTKQAQMTSAIQDALAGQNFQLSEEDKASGLDDVGFGIQDLTQVVYDDGGAKLELTSGHILFRPLLDLDMSWGDDGLDFFELKAAGRLDAEFVVKASFDASYSEEFSKELWSQEWVFVQFIGAFPIVEVVTASLTANFSVDLPLRGSASVGVTVNGSIAGGVRYRDGDYEGFADPPTLEVNTTEPELEGEAKLMVRVELVPKIDVSFYKVAGVSLAVTSGLEVNADIVGTCSVVADVSAGVGASLSLLGFSADYEKTLFERDFPIADCEGFNNNTGDWTCDPAYFDAGDGCDCECGAYDPDCSDPKQEIYNCEAGQTCNSNGMCE